MASAIWSRVKSLRSGSGNTLQGDLKKITDSGCMDVPTELLDIIVEASHDENNRREIMTYLRECLAGPHQGKQWRRLYSALILTEDLMRRGDRCILIETAQGHHFDVIQRLSFLEVYNNADTRAQGLVRSKVTTLQKDLKPKLQNASNELLPKDLEDVQSQGEVSTCADSVISMKTVSTDSVNDSDKPGSPYFSPTVPMNKPGPMVNSSNSRMVLNGIVAVGHSEDTTDESGEDEADRAPVQYRQAKPWKQANLHKNEPQAAPQTAQKISEPTQDLLDLL